jgi:hypothetical protein
LHRLVERERLLVVARGEREEDAARDQRAAEPNAPRCEGWRNEDVVRIAVARECGIDPRPREQNAEHNPRKHDARPHDRRNRMPEDRDLERRSEP